MKKLFSLFLAVMMFLPALMSCGESKENTDAAENRWGAAREIGASSDSNKTHGLPLIRFRSCVSSAAQISPTYAFFSGT